MVTGESYINITSKEILKRISAYDIYRYYLGEFEIGVPFCNPLRGEKNPSMIIREGNYGLHHCDYGNDFYKGREFDIVMQKFMCSYNHALLQIDKDFNLGLSSRKIHNKEVIVKWKQPTLDSKFAPVFNIKTRNFTREELQWWNSYHIDLSDLKRENIYAPKEIWRNGYRVPIINSIYTFCYFYPELGKWKLYRPNAPKLTKNTPIWMYKFDSNVDFDYCDNLKEIKGCKFGFLTKSRKDRIVLTKALGVNCVADTQAEDYACISNKTVAHFKENSEVQVTVFDSDVKGKKTSLYLTENHGWKHCNVPDKYLPDINDFAELGRVYGLDAVTKHFKEKGYI